MGNMRNCLFVAVGLLVAVTSLAPAWAQDQAIRPPRKPLASRQFTSAEIHVAGYLPDGKTLAVLTTTVDPDERPENRVNYAHQNIYSSLRFLDARTLEGDAEMDLGLILNPLPAFSPDGKTLAMLRLGAPQGSPFAVLELWDVPGRSKRVSLPLSIRGFYIPPGTRPLSIAREILMFSPTGKTLAAIEGRGDAVVKLRDAVTGQQRSSIRATGRIECMAFSPNGKSLAIGAEKAESSAPSRGSAAAPKANSHQQIMDNRAGVTVKIYDIASGRAHVTLAGGRPAQTVLFSPDGKLVITGSQDAAEVACFDAHSGKLLGTIVLRSMAERRSPKTHFFREMNLAFSPDGKSLAVTADRDRAITLWDVTSRTQVGSLVGPSKSPASRGGHFMGQGSSRNGPIYSPDGKLVVASSGWSVYVWDEESAGPGPAEPAIRKEENPAAKPAGAAPRRRPAPMPPPKSVDAPASRGKEFTLTWTLDPAKALPAADGSILLPVPSGKPYQEIRYKFTGIKSQKILLKSDSKIVAVQAGSKPFQLQVTVTETEHSFPLPETPKTAPRYSAEIKAYLAHDPTFGPPSDRIQKLAAELKGAGPAETVANIRSWLTGNLKYRFDPKTYRYRTLDELLDRGYTECGGFSALFTALSRDAGIPARQAWGVALAPDGFQNFVPAGCFGSHTWAEVYCEGAGWVPVDPQDAITPLGSVPGNRVLLCSYLLDRKGSGESCKIAMNNLLQMAGGYAVARYEALSP
jgi:transglutaminase-like putative cysteine protease/WD40 repeat protein